VASKPSIRVKKEFTYRGALRSFSNRYYFSGGTPSDSAHWTTFADLVVAREKLIYPAFAAAGARIVATFGFEAGSEIPVFSKTYSTDGTGNTGDVVTPGDVVALVRYSTAARSSKNHPIYCFSYYHAQRQGTGYSGADVLAAANATALNTYSTYWASTGFSDGTNTYKRSSPAGHDVTGYVTESLLTHRDLPRG
jgi:hypothetical protein